VAAVTRTVSCSEKAVFAVGMQMSTTAAHARVELVPLMSARASSIADLIPVDSARAMAIPLVVAFADAIRTQARTPVGVPSVAFAVDPLIAAHPGCSNLPRAACPIADVVASADLVASVAAQEAAVPLLR
jgi:hypothetical protein